MLTTNYKGSEATKTMVAEQIASRWGQEEVGNYNPKSNCATYKQWLTAGYRVIKGQKALKSVTYVEVKDESGEVVQKYPKTVNLFYVRQVEKINA
jgi:hypothetical protein